MIDQSAHSLTTSQVFEKPNIFAYLVVQCRLVNNQFLAIKTKSPRVKFLSFRQINNLNKIAPVNLLNRMHVEVH